MAKMSILCKILIAATLVSLIFSAAGAVEVEPEDSKTPPFESDYFICQNASEQDGEAQLPHLVPQNGLPNRPCLHRRLLLQQRTVHP
ncbi:hypothetical protein PVAP13_8KG370200 [Panicum virgatum]|uniref:Uncharacterized protein n=1 Tax=Panicum virgatum TaxID=38727 RepID=A0A8T0PRW8_PANVG|nr:hypothetical protein PVAP13_8KG370200 [Panicum virgatum]